MRVCVCLNEVWLSNESPPPTATATAAPLYLPHPHSLCLFLSGILIKSADFDSQRLNAHKHTSTHTYSAHYHTFPQRHSSTECLFVLSLHSPCALSDHGSLPTTTPSVCVYMLAYMDGCVCVLRAEGFVYSAESHTYTH